MAGLQAAAGPFRLRPPLGSHFAALVRSITYQQLAGAAASAIHGRLVTALADGVTPEAVLAAPEEKLRGAGLSAAKAPRSGIWPPRRRTARWWPTRAALPGNPTKIPTP
jgi:DNA-3-methyladenine glycosylase II